MNIKIRYNTNYPNKSDKKWRIIIDDFQHLVDGIFIDRPCFTSEDIVKGDDGYDVTKYHISTLAKDVLFLNENDKIIAKII